jgi:hypothetical protein
MTTTTRYPSEPLRLSYKSFFDADADGIIWHAPILRCVTCQTEVGDLPGEFVDFFIDFAGSTEDDAWCETCVEARVEACDE